MSTSAQQDGTAEPAAGSLPVLAEEAVAGEVVQVRAGSTAVIPAVQAAAAAAGGFVAGAAVVGLVARRQRASALAGTRRAGRGLGRSRRRGRGAGELVQIVGSRSLLLDVHLLGGRD
jgi:hypothetical protein